MKFQNYFLVLTALLISCERHTDKIAVICSFITPVADQILINDTPVTLEVDLSHTVLSVTFNFDDESIGTVTTPPYSIQWIPVGYTGGNHIITARIVTQDYETVTSTVNVFFSYHIGENTQGGKVFFIDDSDHHGLVVAFEDLSFQSETSFYWGPEQFIGATDSVDGYSNTQFLASNTNMETYPWNLFKLGYTFNGYSDWYVPSKTEMMLLTEHLKELDGDGMQMMQGVYWTSTECCRSKAVAVDMKTYSAMSVLKTDTMYKIRPIRKF